MSDLTIAQLLPYAPLEVGDETVQTINAEYVHTFLGVKTSYAIWIRREVKKYAFQEGRDFTAIKFDQRKLQTLSGGTIDTTKIEYHITLDMAKQLCMVARQPKGEEARHYFITEEKKLRRIEQHTREYPVPLVVRDGWRLEAAPVCWRCDALMLPYDMAFPMCQKYKVCIRCRKEVWYAATRKERDDGTWAHGIDSDRAKSYGFWKLCTDVPALKQQAAQDSLLLEQELKEEERLLRERLIADTKSHRRLGIKLLA